MKLEDDEEYEAPEPGEIVDEPEGKPVSGPVLSAPPPSPLPSLEALIRPRQDLVPQQRTFPLPFSAAGKPASQSNDRGSANLLNMQPVLPVNLPLISCVGLQCCCTLAICTFTVFSSVVQELLVCPKSACKNGVDSI